MCRVDLLLTDVVRREFNETWLLERRDPIPMGCLSPRKKSFIGHVGGVCRIPWNYTRFIDCLSGSSYLRHGAAV